MSLRAPRPAPALLVVLCACAGVPRDAGRNDVRAEAESRLGIDIAWDADAGRRALAAVDEDGVLDVDEATRLALANNPRLQAILHELDIARAEVWRASLPPNPVADFELQFEDGGGGDLLELSLAQSLIDILLIPRRRQVAQTEFARIRAEVTAAVLDLATETRTSYRRLQGQLELVELLRSATDATYLAYEAARRLRAAGNVRELDVLTERALFEETKVALAEAQARAQEQRENLATLLGLWDRTGEHWRIEPRLPVAAPLDLEAKVLESRVVAASLDLRAMHHAIVALGQSIGLRRVEVTFDTLEAGVVTEREADEGWATGPTLSTSVPLFQFGQAVGALARARMARAYERYTELAVRVRRSARAAYLASATAGENSRYLREVVLPLRVRITEQTQRQFNAMQLGVFRLLEAKREEIEAGRRYVETLRDHWVARVRLESIMLGRIPRARFGLGDMAQDGRSAPADHEPRGDR